MQDAGWPADAIEAASRGTPRANEEPGPPLPAELLADGMEVMVLERPATAVPCTTASTALHALAPTSHFD